MKDNRVLGWHLCTIVSLATYVCYQERLKTLKLPTLKFRRLRGEMIEAYKIIAGIYDERPTEGMFILNTSNTRGHDMKVAKQRLM